jgi:hypothetical protein
MILTSSSYTNKSCGRSKICQARSVPRMKERCSIMPKYNMIHILHTYYEYLCYGITFYWSDNNCVRFGTITLHVEQHHHTLRHSNDQNLRPRRAMQKLSYKFHHHHSINTTILRIL